MAKITIFRLKKDAVKIREISYSGNKPSPYEMKLRSDIKKTITKEKNKRRQKKK